MPIITQRFDEGLFDMASRSRCVVCKREIQQVPILWYNDPYDGYVFYHPSCALERAASLLGDALLPKNTDWMYNRSVYQSVNQVNAYAQVLLLERPRDMCLGCYNKRGSCTCPPAPPHDEDCALCREYEEEW